MARVTTSRDDQHMDHITKTTREGVVTMGLGDRCQQTMVRMVFHVLMWPTEHDGTTRWLISCNFLKVVLAADSLTADHADRWTIYSVQCAQNGTHLQDE